MNFLAFLIVGFSVSNAALLPANFLDNSDLLFPSSPLLGSPLPDSLSLNGPAPGNEPSPFSLNLNAFDPYNNPTSSSPLLGPPPPGSLPLNQPAPGNDPSPFSLDLNAANNPTSSYSLKFAQQPNKNGAGDGGEISTVTPSITYAETQAQTDDSNEICSLDRVTDQKRRKREPSYCGAPGMVEFHPRTPKISPVGSTQQEKKKDGTVWKDNEWLTNRYVEKFGVDWAFRNKQDLLDQMKVWMREAEDACAKQSAGASSTIRVIPLCCVGPRQTMPSHLQIGLAPRQQPATIINWFNCEMLMSERPFCTDMVTTNVCCARHYDNPDPRNQEPALWWRWGFKGVDCVNLGA